MFLEDSAIDYKLDGVGPVDDRPSNDQLHQFVKKKKKKKKRKKYYYYFYYCFYYYYYLLHTRRRLQVSCRPVHHTNLFRTNEQPDHCF